MVEKMRLLIVYNTCGISGHDNSEYYTNSLKSIMGLDKDDLVVVSDCLNPPEIREKLVRENGGELAYSWIDDKVPVNVSFNKTVQECVKHYGPFEGYFYVDSGIVFPLDYTSQRKGAHIFDRLYDLFKSGPYGMVSVKTDDDGGFEGWFGEDLLQDKEHFIIPVGKACNLHTTIFSHKLYEAYDNRCIPDVFAANCSESTFSFVNAAIGLKWILHGDIILHHQKSVDGASAGFGFPHPWDHTFKSPRTMRQIVLDPAGHQCGFGYEECNGVLYHNPDCFDEEGFCTNTQLKDFILENIFTHPPHFDYNDIKCEFIPSGT